MKGAKKLLSGESLGAALAGSGPPAASTRSKKEQTQAVSSSEEILDEQDHSDETMTSPRIESGAGHPKLQKHNNKSYLNSLRDPPYHTKKKDQIKLEPNAYLSSTIKINW